MADLTALIPHGPPILCVDRVLEASDSKAAAEHTVRSGEEWEGLLIEGLAQTAAVLDSCHGGRKRPGAGLLVGLRAFEIRRLPRAGERVEFRVELIRRLAPLVLVHGRAVAGEELLAEGELKFFIEGTR
jgi:3-hydroxymyristoyl/3-hydroxydecanoyl-(acyl carrier protein) dehydratase